MPENNEPAGSAVTLDPVRPRTFAPLPQEDQPAPDPLVKTPRLSSNSSPFAKIPGVLPAPRPFKRQEFSGQIEPVIDATQGGSPIGFRVVVPEGEAVHGEKENEIPEERRNELLRMGMHAVADNPIVDQEGGAFDQATAIADPQERELFLEGAAEEIAHQEIAPKDINGGRAPRVTIEETRTVATEEIKRKYEIWALAHGSKPIEPQKLAKKAG